MIVYSLNACFTAKFNCTVPGTLHDFTEECNITAMVKTPGAETTSIVTAMVTTTITSTSESIHIATNHAPICTYTAVSVPLLASFIGDAIIVVILAISIIIIVCVIIRFKVGRNGQTTCCTPSSSVTASINTAPQAKSLGKLQSILGPTMAKNYT